MNKFLIGLVKITGWPLQFFAFRKKIHYEDRRVQGRKIKGPAIIISNHTAVYDYAVMIYVFFGRILRCIMAEVLQQKKGLGGFLKAMGGIFVDRGGHDFGFVRQSLDILKEEGVVEIFPESRLPLPNEARPLPFKTVAGYLALTSGAPVIPVYTDGSYFRKTRAHVIIGKPIDASLLARDDCSDQENIQNITDALRKDIIRLGKLLDQKKKEKKRSPFYYFVYDFAKITAGIPLLFWFRPKIRYTDKKKTTGIRVGMLVVSNHISLWDPVILQLGIWRRRVHLTAMEELFEKKPLGSLLKAFRVIPINRDNFNFGSFREITETLDRGKAVGIFPEGAVNTDTSTVAGYKSGMILMAHKSRVPIVPVYLKKRDHWYQRQQIMIGAPVDISGICGKMPTLAQIDEAAEQLREQELALMNTLQQKNRRNINADQN